MEDAFVFKQTCYVVDEQTYIAGRGSKENERDGLD